MVSQFTISWFKLSRLNRGQGICDVHKLRKSVKVHTRWTYLLYICVKHLQNFTFWHCFIYSISCEHLFYLKKRIQRPLRKFSTYLGPRSLLLTYVYIIWDLEVCLYIKNDAKKILKIFVTSKVNSFIWYASHCKTNRGASRWFWEGAQVYL